MDVAWVWAGLAVKDPPSWVDGFDAVSVVEVEVSSAAVGAALA